MSEQEIRIDADELLGKDLDDGLDIEYLAAMRYHHQRQYPIPMNPSPAELGRQSLNDFYKGLEAISKEYKLLNNLEP